jgi:hypothetical protein
MLSWQFLRCVCCERGFLRLEKFPRTQYTNNNKPAGGALFAAAQRASEPLNTPPRAGRRCYGEIHCSPEQQQGRLGPNTMRSQPFLPAFAHFTFLRIKARACVLMVQTKCWERPLFPSARVSYHGTQLRWEIGQEVPGSLVRECFTCFSHTIGPFPTENDINNGRLMQYFSL